MTDLTAREVIDRLGLEPLGFEGGYYRETHRHPVEIPGTGLPEVYGGPRNVSTAIFYMLTPTSFSLMHRLQTDEVYHFYLGDPADLLLLHPDGTSESVPLGPDLRAGQRIQQVVRAGVWQGSSLRPGGRFALMGTTMAPGFDLRDFQLGDRDTLVATWPERADRIRALTPARLKTQRFELAAETLDLLHAELRARDALAAGLDATLDPAWPPEGRDPDALRAAIARLEASPADRRWGGWYVLRRADRRLIGVAGFAGPPGPDGVVLRPPRLLAEADGADEVQTALRAEADQIAAAAAATYSV